MKKFKNVKEMYLKIVDLQDEIKDILQSYIEKEDIGTNNFEEKLYNQFNEVTNIIFDELNSKSKNLEFLTDHMENEDGDVQIVTAFIRAYVTDKLMEEVVSFEFEYEAQYV